MGASIRTVAAAAVVCLGWIQSAAAIPVVFSFSSTVAYIRECPSGGSVDGSCPPGDQALVDSTSPVIDIGDEVVVRVYADNGGSTLANQAWSQSSVFLATVVAGDYRAAYAGRFLDAFASRNWFVTDSTGAFSLVAFNGGAVGGQVGLDVFGIGGEVGLANGTFIDYFGRFVTLEHVFSVLSFDQGQYDPRSRWTVSLVSEATNTLTLFVMGLGVAALASRRPKQIRPRS